MRGKYLPRQRLMELDRILSDRDKAVLRSLQSCRYLITGQVQRLHFTESASPSAALRAATRALRKLNDYGLTEIMERRIGGVRAGSKSYIWALTESGVNLLHLHDEDYSPRKRSFEPSMNFLKHTLEVSETYVQLTEICRRQSPELIKTELEPTCWRSYAGEGGKPASMKPDMYAVTVNDKYEDSWFIELDMGTQSPAVVMEKCQRYVQYCKSGIEQKQHGVFPLVVWIMPSAARKENLKQRIAESKELQLKNIFLVITPDEFETLICEGLQALTKTEGEKQHEQA